MLGSYRTCPGSEQKDTGLCEDGCHHPRSAGTHSLDCGSASEFLQLCGFLPGFIGRTQRLEQGKDAEYVSKRTCCWITKRLRLGEAVTLAARPGGQQPLVGAGH